MLQFLKTKLFGSKIFQRASSVDVKSKYKNEGATKRPMSIDSKQKDHNEREMRRGRELPEIIEGSASYEQQQSGDREGFEGEEDLENIVVSGGLSEGSFENLLQELNEEENDFSLSFLKEDTANHKGRIFPNFSNNRQTNKKHGNFNQNLSKNHRFLVKRSTSKKVIKRIQEKCSICKTYLSYPESVQLACTHRCHKHCVVKMQLRMRYKCDLCEERNEKKFTGHK